MPSLVALDLPGGQTFVDELVRCWDQGDAVLPLDTRLPSDARRRLATEMGTSMVVDESGRHLLDGGRPTEDGDALVVATSGTTGAPKGAVLTMTAVEASARLTSAALDVQASDKWLACLPLAHIGGLSVLTRSLITGTAFSVVPAPDPQAIEDAAGDGANLVSLVPAVLNRVSTGQWKRILLGGGPMPEGLPANAVRTYGMTETGSGVVYDGRALPGVEIVTDDRQRLLVRSPTLMRSYRNGEPGLDAHGWFATGDAGHVDDKGTVTVHGRFDDAIVTGGEKVWPAEVENLLRTHPAIAEALVHGTPDAQWGEVVTASVEVHEGAQPPTVAELRDFLGGSVIRHAAPRKVIVVERLERTAIGKLKRPRTSARF